MNIIIINSTGKESPPDVGVQSTKVYLVCNEPFPAKEFLYVFWNLEGKNWDKKRTLWKVSKHKKDKCNF